MKFFIAATTLIAAAAAQYSAAPEECEVVTVTVTSTLKHLPSAPGSAKATGPAPYPTKAATPVVALGTAPATPLAGTAAVVVKASGTGAPSASSPAQFTGAASSVKVGGFVAGLGAFAAVFL